MTLEGSRTSIILIEREEFSGPCQKDSLPKKNGDCFTRVPSILLTPARVFSTKVLPPIRNRQAAQWHTQTRTGKSGVLRNLSPAYNYLEIHPLDALKYGIESGREVKVASLRGSVTVQAFVTPTVPEGAVFMPMHEETTNRLTLNFVDPYSRQPSYKSCAVAVSMVEK